MQEQGLRGMVRGERGDSSDDDEEITSLLSIVELAVSPCGDAALNL